MQPKQLTIDTGQINFVNNLTKNLVLWTQYEECDKCALIKKEILIKSKVSTLLFPSYYTLRYKINETGTGTTGTSCENTLSFRDQSITDIVISTEQCLVQTKYEGRDDYLPLWLAILFIFLFAVIFYVLRFYYKKWKSGGDDQNEENEDLSSKIKQRLNSLDAFRGLSILLMIFVNWGAGEYHVLDHAEWNGMHFADFIFPSFIFIMGVTMAISIKSLVINKNLPLHKIYWIVTKRSLKLFLVGIVLGSRGNADLRYIRIPGVLQRFSVSFFFVASVHVLSLHINRDTLYSHVAYLSDIMPYWPDWILSGVMFVLYFALTFGWKFDPDCPRGYLGPGGYHDNSKYAYCVGGAANKLDKLVFTENHIYRHFTALKLYDPDNQYQLKHDPEGLLGVTTSILLTMIGLQVGKILLTYKSTKQRLIRWSIWAVVLGLLTAILAGTGVIPINKNLWSFTFVCITGSVAIVIFAGFYLLIDHYKVWPNGQPLHYPGMNSILLYIGHGFTGGMLPFAYITQTNSHAWLLTQNITGVFLWLLISIYLARKNYFFTL